MNNAINEIKNTLEATNRILLVMNVVIEMLIILYVQNVEVKM